MRPRFVRCGPSSVEASVTLGRECEGHVGLAHGGHLAHWTDEAIGCAAIADYPNRLLVTARLSVEYLRPVHTPDRFRIRAALTSDHRFLVHATAEVTDGDGTAVVRANAVLARPQGVRQPPPLGAPRALIFDLDGTLVDSEGVCRDALIGAATGLGHTLTDAEYDARFRGLALDVVCAELFGDPVLASACLERARCAIDQATATVRPLRGVEALLDRTSDLPRAVATSADRPTAVRLLGAAGLFDRFPILVTGSDVRRDRGKPHPDIYVAAAERLRTAPRECLVFEDSAVGLAAARAAGMRVVLVGACRWPPPADADLTVRDYAASPMQALFPDGGASCVDESPS